MTLKPKFFADDIIDGITVVLGLEGCLSCNKLIKGDSYCPRINLLSIASSEKHLRGLIIASSRIGEHFLIPPSQFHIFAYSEINQLHDPFLNIAKNVGRFDVPVADIFLMEIG